MEELLRGMNEYMVKHNLKRYELAGKLGTTQSNVTNWLNGKCKISKAWQIIIKQRLELE